MIAKNVPTQFAIALVPDEEDWSWIPNCPDLSNYKVGSQMMIGDYNFKNWYNAQYPLPVDIKTKEGSAQWDHTLDQFAFGFYNANSGTESYHNLTTDTYNEGLFSIGHPGIGLPSPIFTPFVEMLQELTNNIWTCTEKYGYFCTAPVKCSTFTGEEGSSYDLTDYNFKVIYTSGNDTYVRVPILSLMRNSQTVASQCNLMIYYLDPTKYMSS